MTEVRADLKYVLNLGNYESAHIAFGITDDVKPGEKVGEAANRVWAKVESLVQEQVEIYEESARKES